MSAISQNAMDTANGRIRNIRASLRRAPYPISKLQQKAIVTINPHAGVGMRFHHAACVYPCEFNTSFMPEMARATSGVGCAVRDRTADHNSFWSSAVSELIFASFCWLRVV